MDNYSLITRIRICFSFSFSFRKDRHTYTRVINTLQERFVVNSCRRGLPFIQRQTKHHRQTECMLSWQEWYSLLNFKNFLELSIHSSKSRRVLSFNWIFHLVIKCEVACTSNYRIRDSILSNCVVHLNLKTESSRMKK